MLSCVRTRPSARASMTRVSIGCSLPNRFRIVAEPFAAAPAAARRQRDDRSRMRFGLHISEFPWAPDELRRAVASVAVRAEAAGFDAIWVMDHFRQIPQIGRAWDDMPESWTTLAYLAGVTERIGLGTWSPGSRTGTWRISPRSSRRGRAQRRAGRDAASASDGSSRSIAPTGGTSRRRRTGTPCSRTHLRCCR